MEIALTVAIIVWLAIILVLEIVIDLRRFNSSQGYQPDGHIKLDRNNPPRQNSS